MEQIDENEEVSGASINLESSGSAPRTATSSNDQNSRSSRRRRSSIVMPSQAADALSSGSAELPQGLMQAVAEATSRHAEKMSEQRPSVGGAKGDTVTDAGMSDWDHLYWAAMAGTSPTLQLCRDIDGHVIVLLEDLADLAAWRRDVFDQRILPLPHFTRLSTVCSRLSRAKSTLANGVTFLLAQVRALLVEATNEESLQLQRELQLRRNDPSMHLEEEIEQLSSELENAQIEFHELKHLKNWERLITTVEFKLFEQNFRDKLQKSLTKYIKHVKEKNTLGNLWITDEKGATGGVTGESGAPGKGKKGAAKGKASVRQQAILKREAEKIEKHQATLKKREEKLSYQQERFREAYREFEASKKEMEKKIQEEREFVRNSRLAQDKMAIILDQRKKDLETEKEKINVNFHKKAEELAERETEIDARFPELSKVEGQIAEQLRNLHRTAQNNLRQLQHANVSEEAAKVAADALKFAHAHAKDMKFHGDNANVNTSRPGSRASSHHGHRKHKVPTADVGVQYAASDLTHTAADQPPLPQTPPAASAPAGELAKESDASSPMPEPPIAKEEGPAPEDLPDEGPASEPVLDASGEGDAQQELLAESKELSEEGGKAEGAGEQETEAAAEGVDAEGDAGSEANPPASGDEEGEAGPEGGGEEAGPEGGGAEAEVAEEVAEVAMVSVAEVQGLAGLVEGRAIERANTPAVVVGARLRTPEGRRVDDSVLAFKDEEIAELQAKCGQLEQKVAALDMFSEEEKERVRAQQARAQIDLELAVQRLEVEKRAFAEHVKSFTRSEEDKNLLLQKLDGLARAKQGAELAAEAQAQEARRVALAKQEEDLGKTRGELVEREQTVRELALKVEHALEQADGEQREFEESMLDRNRVMREREHELEKKRKFLAAEEGKEVNVLRKQLREEAEAREGEVAQKKANLEKLEASLAREIEKLHKNAEQEVGTLLKKERADLERREGLLESRLHSVDVQLAKVQEAGQARKLMAEAEARMAKADARMGEAQTKELELRAAVTTLEIQQEALKAAQQGMVGAGAGEDGRLKTEYEAKVRSLHLQMKDYKAQVKALRAQLARQESREILRSKRAQAHTLARDPASRTPSGAGWPGTAEGEGGLGLERPLTPMDGAWEDFPEMHGTFSRFKEADEDEHWATLEGPETEAQRVEDLQLELRERIKGLQAEQRARRLEHETAMVRVKEREKALAGQPNPEHVHEVELAERRHREELRRLQVRLDGGRERLRQKQEQLQVAVAEVDTQLAHLREIRASEAKLVQHAQQLFHGLEADVAGLDANLLLSSRLANDKNITLKHLSTLLEVYRVKVANLDGAIKARKRKGEADGKSALPREAGESVDAAVVLKVEALTNREQAFVLEAARPAPDDASPEQGATLHVVEPRLFEHPHGEGGDAAEEDRVEALPAIFLPGAPKQAASPSKRLMGAGLARGSAAHRALLRHTVSAPTGERKVKIDLYGSQGPVVQTSDSPAEHPGLAPVKNAA